MKVLKCLKALTSENFLYHWQYSSTNLTVDAGERGSTMLCVFVLAFAPYYTTARVIKQGYIELAVSSPWKHPHLASVVHKSFVLSVEVQGIIVFITR